MRAAVWVCTCVVACALLPAGCSTAPKSAEEQAQLTTRSESAIEMAMKADSGLQKFFDTAAGYAVFPSAGKGAVGVGGAYGRGEVFESGKPVGYATLTQASIGLALGGQKFAYQPIQTP